MEIKSSPSQLKTTRERERDYSGDCNDLNVVNEGYTNNNKKECLMVAIRLQLNDKSSFESCNATNEPLLYQGQGPSSLVPRSLATLAT